MAKLSHPNVVRYYTAWLEENAVGIMKKEDSSSETESEECNGPILFIQLELCFGSLKELMGATLPDSKIWFFFQQLLEGLVYIHGKDIRHGDLSPANVLVDVSGEIIKIADFGLASLVGEGLLAKGELVAETIYHAPELDEKRFYPSSDIYSLGLILFEMFARFDTNMAKPKAFGLIKKDPVRVQECLPHLEDEIILLISSMIHSDPLHRPTAKEILSMHPWKN